VNENVKKPAPGNLSSVSLPALPTNAASRFDLALEAAGVFADRWATLGFEHRESFTKELAALLFGVALGEREACAKLCKSKATASEVKWSGKGSGNVAYNVARSICADAIRARGAS
jgi:hypothetical protein